MTKKEKLKEYLKTLYQKHMPYATHADMALIDPPISTEEWGRILEEAKDLIVPSMTLVVPVNTPWKLIKIGAYLEPKSYWGKEGNYKSAQTGTGSLPNNNSSKKKVNE